MATSSNSRGVSRVLEKLERSVEDGNYYEAHQMYRTLYFRYLGQKKYNELLDMLYNGSVLFLEHEQNISGADLGILLVEVLVKSETCNFSEWIPKLSTIFAKISISTPERDTYIMNCIRWSSSNGHFNHGHPVLHQQVAQVYWNEKNYSQAKHHYIYSKDGKNCAKLLIELQTSQGFRSEIDLFIAQAVLQFLCLNNQITANQTFLSYTAQHPNIKKEGPPYLLPLLNFLWFLLQAIESGKLTTFVIICEQYKPSIKRDPVYLQYLDRIGQIFFGVEPPQQKPDRLFGNLLNNFLGGLTEDSDDDSSPDQPLSESKIQETSELD